MASSGNFCVMNPLLALDDSGNKGITFSKGNLRGQNTVNGIQTMGTMAVKSGKWYYEERYDADANINDARLQVGVQALGDFSGLYDGEIYTARRSTSSRFQGTHIYYLRPNYQGGKLSHPTSLGWDYGNNDSGSSNDGIRVNAVGDIYMIALDLDNYKFYIGRNGTWYSNNVAGATGSNTDITQVDGWSIESTWQGSFWTPVLWIAGASSGTAGYFNFGQDSTFGGQETAGGNTDTNGFGDFKYSVPSGYQAWTSANLPISDDIDPGQTSDDFPQKQFGVVTYTGNASTNNISNLNFKPDLVWIKIRNTASNGVFVNSSTGTNKMMHPNNTDAEVTTANLTSFNSDGFSLDGTYNYQANYNGNSNTYVAWCWRCGGGITSADDSGDITVARQTNDASKFSILTYSGSGTDGQTVAHGLGVEPDFIIATPRNSSGSNRVVWIRGLTLNGSSSEFLKLNTNDSVAQSGQIITVSSSTIGVGGNANLSGKDQLLYAWASVEGFSSFGKWVGNGQSSGAVIQIGFKPRLIFIKGDNSGDWVVIDTARATVNTTNNALTWNLANSEQTSNREIDILSNGFRILTSNSNLNSDGTTYYYGAWGDPFKYGNTFP